MTCCTKGPRLHQRQKDANNPNIHFGQTVKQDTRGQKLSGRQSSANTGRAFEQLVRERFPGPLTRSNKITQDIFSLSNAICLSAMTNLPSPPIY